MMFQSCSFDDQETAYEEKLVVFASIVANMPVTDTVFVSRSASLEEDVTAMGVISQFDLVQVWRRSQNI